MSIQALSWVFDHSRSQGTARNVLFSIANHADESGSEAWPSVDTIAREANCGRATVFRVLPVLKELGEVNWAPGGGREGARRKSNFYWMPLMRMQKGLPGDPVDNSATRSQSETPCKRQGRISSSTRSQSETDKVSPLRHEPSLTVQEPVRVARDNQPHDERPWIVAETERRLLADKFGIVN